MPGLNVTKLRMLGFEDATMSGTKWTPVATASVCAIATSRCSFPSVKSADATAFRIAATLTSAFCGTPCLFYSRWASSFVAYENVGRWAASQFFPLLRLAA